MRFLVFFAAILVVIGFVRPQTLRASAIEGKLQVALSEVQQAIEDTRVAYAKTDDGEKSAEVRRMFTLINIAATDGNPQTCRKLEPIPLYLGAPSIGDWISYCLARVRTDSDRCEKITDLISPQLKKLCLKEFSR